MSSNASATSQLNANQLNAVYFVNSDLDDLATLLAGVPQGAQVVLLDPAQDGLTQMLAALQGRTGLDAIHLIGHGSSGLIDLGSTRVTTQTLTERATEIATLGSALSSSGDILLYGCDVAAGDAGAAFVSQLSSLTGADVAASTNLTGAANLGGDWVLETQTGVIEANPLAAVGYSGVLGFMDFTFTLGTIQWNRPSIGTSPFTTVTAGTTAYNYSWVKFQSTNTGVYDFSVTSSTVDDPVIFLYAGAFAANVPTANFYIGDDDSADTLFGAADNLWAGLNNVNLTAGTDYYVVLSTFNAVDEGSIGFRIWGDTTDNPNGGITIGGGTVIVPNRAPTAGSGADFYFNEGSSGNVSLTTGNTGSSDPDGDTLSNYSSPSYSISTNASLKGNIFVTSASYTVTDPGGLTANGSIDIYGTYADDVTSWGSPPAGTTWAASGSNSYNWASGASDSDDSVSYTYVSGAPSWMTTGTTLSGNVAPQYAGQSYTINVRASGSTNQDRSFSITIGSAASVNDLPTSTGGSKSVAEDGNVAFASGDFGFADLDNSAGGSTATGAALRWPASRL